MTGYDFHPEAFPADSPDAADRIIAEILGSIRVLVRFPNQGHIPPDLTSRPLRFVRVRENLNCLRPRRYPAVGHSGPAWPP